MNIGFNSTAQRQQIGFGLNENAQKVLLGRVADGLSATIPAVSAYAIARNNGASQTVAIGTGLVTGGVFAKVFSICRKAIEKLNL